MAVSTRLRFEVFKRDGFRCTYCGANPVQSTLAVKELHADHVDPKSKGGSDEAHNLVTACVDCNLGKSDVPLDKVRLRSGFATDEEREHADQIREYLAAQREIVEAKRDVESMVLAHWQDRMGDFYWQLPRFIPGAVKEFGIEAVLDAVDVTARKDISSQNDQVRYFCGVLRRMREQIEQAKQPASKMYTLGELNLACDDMAEAYLSDYWLYRVGSKYPGKITASLVGMYRKADGTATGFVAADVFTIIDYVTFIREECAGPDWKCDVEFRGILATSKGGPLTKDVTGWNVFIHFELADKEEP